MTEDMTHATLIPSLAAIVGADAVLTGAAAAPHYNDWRGRYTGSALAVVLPSDTRQVSEVVTLCAAKRIAIVPQAGNTSLCGASVPLADDGAQIVLNLSRMNRIREFDAVNYTMTVEAGCILADVREAAKQGNRLFALGLTATENICEIGGNLSTNAGGIAVLRYGTARDLVLGLEVVLPDGRIWNGLRALRKDNTGYGLKHLFIGAEGTLGIITAAVLKLSPRPQSSATACVAIAGPEVGVRLLAHLRAVLGDTLSSFELFSRSCLDLVLAHIPGTQEPFAQRHAWYLLIQAEDVLQTPLEAELRGALENFGDGIEEFGTASDAARDWWVLRESIAEAQKREGASIKHDVAVPVSRVADFIAEADIALQQQFPDARNVTFGHMGDGNVHYNVSHRDAARNKDFIAQQEGAVNRLVYEVIRSLDGTISAEHGIGQLKRDILPDFKDPLEYELMHGIKQMIDPHGLMNPGKMF
ncbi:MAG: hydroxyacid dehydrogenase [Gallionellales bacterium GWA2_60_18]|nr:MAG: hydroxyacid dehydrogenase [Gallionellales bacterium GWA2_60_18]